jgi:DNA uptake protein ComE-like DNA-binding protein
MRILVLTLVAALALSAAPAQKKGGKAADAPKAATAADTKPSGALIDVNSASVDQLKTLPGIGDAYSEKIVKNRPYHGKNEIVSKAGVPQATYDKIKDQIVAHQAKGSAAKKK